MCEIEFNITGLSSKIISGSSKCIIFFNLGIEEYSGEKLKALLSLINKNFNECTIILGDSLQRHNFPFFKEHSKESFEKACNNEGTEWLNQNFHYFIDELKIPFKIVRWNYFLNHEKYPEFLKKIEELCQNNENYNSILAKTAEEYIDRQSSLASKNKEIYDACYKYLIEEAAAMCIWPEFQSEYEIYISKRNDLMNLVYQDILKPEYGNLLQPLSLRYKKKNNEKDIQSVLDSDALKNIVEILPGNIYWKNKDGVYLGCNVELARYYGYNSVSDIINKTDYDFFEKDIADKLREHDIYIMKEQTPKIIEERNLDDYFLSNKAPIKNLKGEIIGIVGCSINITPQKDLEIKKLKKQTLVLTEALKTKDRFLNNISHEIRTPLHVISAIISELSTEYYNLSDDERLEFIKLTKNTTDKLTKFVKNILLLAKSKKKNLNSKFENVDMIELAKSVIDEISVISSSDISIDIPDEHEKIIVSCTKYQIEQVIRNLLENSIKYGLNKPINVRVSKDKNDAKIEFIDQGLGIPKDERIKIFEAFQESSITQNMSGGTGLGLAICKDILNLHKGKIWVNPDYTSGAHFIFTLPLSRAKNGKL